MSLKISQMVPTDLRDGLIPVAITNQEGVENRTVPVRNIWSPTLLVQLFTQNGTNDTVFSQNHWDYETVLHSDEVEFDGDELQFMFLKAGLYEINVVGETAAKDSYGERKSWPEGSSQLDIRLNPFSGSVIPTPPLGDDLAHRRISRHVDAYTEAGAIGFSEKFYMNVPDLSNLLTRIFKIHAIVNRPMGSDFFHTNLAVSVKRITQEETGV